jgi:hypothetical protein
MKAHRAARGDLQDLDRPANHLAALLREFQPHSALCKVRLWLAGLPELPPPDLSSIAPSLQDPPEHCARYSVASYSLNIPANGLQAN